MCKEIPLSLEQYSNCFATCCNVHVENHAVDTSNMYTNAWILVVYVVEYQSP